jgi:hypothetical protein
MSRDGNLGIVSDTYWDGAEYRDNFLPVVAFEPDLNRDRYGADIFFHPRVTRWVSDTLLPL